jgi:hypothetical protein
MRAVAAFVCALLVSTTATAQGIAYGAKAGVSFSNLKTDPETEPSYDSRFGLTAGGFVAWPLTARLDVQPEALFTMKGGSVEDGPANAVVKLDYLDVPVLVKYRLFGSPGHAVHVFGGPSFGVRLRGIVTTEIGGESIDNDVSDDVTRMDLGIVGGAGVDIGRLIVEGRYTWGVSDIDKDTSDESKVRNRTAAALVGFRF